jgi:RNA polymerase sigma factor (sigma-70 family)
LTLSGLYSNKQPKFSDEEIVVGIRCDNSDALKYVYEEYFQSVYLNIVKGDLLNEEDARDIFHEAIMIVYNNIRKEAFVLERSFAAFLFSICKKLVLKRLRWEYRALNNRGENIDQIPGEDEKPIEIYPEIEFNTTEEIKFGLFSKYFILLKEDCRNVLTLAFSGVSYDEIARLMGYKKGTYAKSKRHRCKGYLVKSIMKDKLFKLLKDE